MSITLATTDTIAGVSGSSNSITYTITGDEVGTGDTFKVLTQGVLFTSAATIYTVPAATSTIVKTMHLVNTTTSNATASLTLKGTGPGNQILPPITILAGGFSVFGDDGWQTYNNQGQILSVGSTGATGATGPGGLATSGVPAVVLSTTAAAGVAATALATDAQIIAFDSTVPVTQAFGDAAAVGVAAITARRDHRHGMPSVAFGSNATDVSSVSAPGTIASNSRADHVHRGVHLLTSNASNTLFGDVNLQAGTGIALGVTAQTITITSLAAGGSGGGGMTNPMTTKGDLIAGGTAGAATRLPVGANTQVLTADSAQALGVKWAAAGGGGIGAFPTLIQQSNFASASAASPVITLGSTPVAADVIIVAACNVQYAVDTVTGAGATWLPLGGQHIQIGSYVMFDLWMGVVGASPTTTITINFTGANTYYIAAAVYRGLSGLVEWVSTKESYDNSSNPAIQLALPPKTPTKSPLAIIGAFMRGQGSPIIPTGYTNITTGSAGGDRAFLAYQDVSAGTKTSGGQFTGATTAGQNMVAVSALIW